MAASSFKQALAQAADNALAAGTLDTASYARIADIATGPSTNRAKSLEYAVAHLLSSHTRAASVGAFDWMQLIPQIQAIIAAVSAIINIIHPPTPAPPPVHL